MLITITRDFNNKYSVQLTDTHIICSQRKFKSEPKALDYIKLLENKGHKVSGTSELYMNMLLEVE